MKKILLITLLLASTSLVYAADKQLAIAETPSVTADWIHFSGPSTAANWIHFSGPSPAATYVYTTDNCHESPIQLLDSSPTYADLIFVSGPSTAADWIHLSGPSTAADWYHITSNESIAEIKLCIPNEELRTEKNIAILLHILQQSD
ncbi:hypothetical protein [Enterovibrio norvegicus]|uniref:Uncharacterized protein n=1 Tax=Enterovibrio norvegicus DSM 15893 TaxID=1121869 RepID=A0A1I5VJQ2_9GAMM|nr:hypothetical protein [Enterovibrio norvegicus]SFQ07216.1 hypothetical protein SAMN03084138_03964 [Enterovibrio norvegicus DSM 15893]